ncbi:MAG: hypothetical protein ACTTKL_03505 [Treponema sp.]
MRRSRNGNGVVRRKRGIFADNRNYLSRNTVTRAEYGTITKKSAPSARNVTGFPVS